MFTPNFMVSRYVELLCRHRRPVMATWFVFVVFCAVYAADFIDATCVLARAARRRRACMRRQDA
jgi:hypothetical protein